MSEKLIMRWGMQDLESRVTNLEISLAHQQHLCEQLNEVVTDQSRQLLQLAQLIPQLRQQIKELTSQPKKQQFDPGDERPPHY